MKNILIPFCLGLVVLITSCDSYFEPKLTNDRTLDQLLTEPQSVRGLLTYAYNSIPSTYNRYGGDFLDCGTDNALSNVLTGSMNQLVSIDGYWNSQINPLNVWASRYDQLVNLNQFIEIGLDGTVIYFKDPLQADRDEAFRKRLRGEAYFLRAWIHFDLLRRYGGIDESGQLMGIPLMTATMDINGEGIFDIPRNTYQECVTQILSDLDVALSSDSALPEDYTIGDQDEDFGENNIGRPTTIACLALKSRVLLYAASPAFGSSSYSQAAEAAQDVIDVIGTTLPDVYGSGYFTDDTNDELIMRRVSGGAGGATSSLEAANFPPSINGGGRTNPSQNLVDAFPMANGYPIDNPLSGYDEDDMYANRDPRLDMTVIYNNKEFKGETIETFEGGNNMPGAPRVTVENSTRTRYYLRKWLSEGVSVIDNNIINAVHYYAIFRKGEIFLNFAEAANEAFGPDDTSFGLSARQAIAEVRRRAGIAAGGSDDYLASITTQAEMRELIRNERRIELCFEEHRFFDLRRWDVNLNEPIQGVRITDAGGGVFNFTRETLVVPSFRDYMIYGPIPFGEILVTNNITQNQGW
ncbi:MAG: RagB/SusD family nutrient uptake outer membrane protein [Jejuia sp.]